MCTQQKYLVGFSFFTSPSPVCALGSAGGSRLNFCCPHQKCCPCKGHLRLPLNLHAFPGEPKQFELYRKHDICKIVRTTTSCGAILH